MINRALCVAAIIVLFVIASGCSGGETPMSGPLQSTQSQSDGSTHVSRTLWGIWDCTMVPGSNEITVTPLRGAMFTANVNSLLEGKPGNLLITDLDLTNLNTQGRLDCTVTLKHPFPGLDQYDGFDVWGVFMHNGTESLDYDGLEYGNPMSGNDEAGLVNADGYTRWFNEPEFDGGGLPLVEFHGGKLANIPAPTATLNPFKIFADNLGNEDDYYTWITNSTHSTDRGIFKAGQANSRRYQLKFPVIGGAPVVNFQYAVIASWEPGDPASSGNPSAYEPGDFPSSANAEEAYFIHTSTVASDLYNDGAGHSGGNFKASIEVFDWQGGSVDHTGVPSEVNRLILEGNFLPGGKAEFSQAQFAAGASAASENSSVFEVDIPNCTPLASGDLQFWTVVESAGLNGGSYGQGFPTKYPTDAKRAAFSTGTVYSTYKTPTITILSPNGSEVWNVGSQQNITWTSTGAVANVKIEYSKDNFVSNFQTIVDSTPNTGSYPWIVPNDPLVPVRVRVSDVPDPTIFDISDADFMIQSAEKYWNQYMATAGHDGRTTVVGPATNSMVWAYPVSGDFPYLVVEGFDGTIYFGSGGSGDVHAVNPDGSKKWDFSPSTPGAFGQPMGVSTDNMIVYVGVSDMTFDGWVYGVSVEDGTELWKYNNCVWAATHGLILENGDLVFAGDDAPAGFGNYVTVRLNEGGDEVWKVPTGWNWCTSPAQGIDGQIYTKSTFDILALDPDTGAQLHSYAYPSSANMQTDFAVRSDGSVIFGTNTTVSDCMVYCLDKDLNPVWSVPCTGGGMVIDGFGIGPNDEVYATSNGMLFAITPDGSLDWTYPGSGVWTAAAVGGDGTVYVGTGNGVMALSPEGSLVWKYTGGSGYTSQPIIAHDGSLYANVYSVLTKFKD